VKLLSHALNRDCSSTLRVTTQVIIDMRKTMSYTSMCLFNSIDSPSRQRDQFLSFIPRRNIFGSDHLAANLECKLKGLMGSLLADLIYCLRRVSTTLRHRPFEFSVAPDLNPVGRQASWAG
jgi:hypothetical protein